MARMLRLHHPSNSDVVTLTAPRRRSASTSALVPLPHRIAAGPRPMALSLVPPGPSRIVSTLLPRRAQAARPLPLSGSLPAPPRVGPASSDAR